MITYIKKFFENNRKILKYKDYDVNAFLKDEFFKKWVLYNDVESRHFWDKWLSNNPEKTKEVLQAKEIISSIDYKNKIEIEHEDYLEIYEKILAETPKFHKFDGWIEYFTLKNIAAIIVVFILAIFSITYYQDLKSTEEVKENVALVTKKTLEGNKLTFYLNDGTKVKLNSNSQLIFPLTFQDSTREVYLKGEAFFEVSENKEKPFIVKGEFLEAKVLGTSFNFNTDKGKHEIALVSGKLKVSDSLGHSALLNPSQMITYENGKLEKREFDTINKIAWIEGIIYFDAATGNEVTKTLEAWYGITFKFEKGYAFHGKFSGNFKNEPLANVLNVLSRSSDFKYKIEGDQIFISKDNQRKL